MADVAAGKIEAAFDRKMSFVFDLLGDDFAEDELFGEIFGADDDAVGARRAAGSEQQRRREREWQRAECMRAEIGNDVLALGASICILPTAYAWVFRGRSRLLRMTMHQSRPA